MDQLFKISLKLLLVLFLAITHVSPGQDENDEDLYKLSNPNFSTGASSYYYSPGDTAKIRFSANWMNIAAVFDVTVYRIKDPELFFIKQSQYYTFALLGKDSTNLSDVLEQTDKYKYKAKVIKDSTNWKGKITYRYRIDDWSNYVPKINGVYLIKVSFRKKIAYTGFIVTDIGLITQPANNSVLCYTAERKTGDAIDGVKLAYYLGGKKSGEGLTANGVYNKLITDEEKIIAAKTGIFNPFVIAMKDEDVSISDPSAFFNFTQNRYTCYIYTNQPVYRPPAKVDFKVVLREFTGNGYENFPNRQVVVASYDVKGAEIFKKVLMTNEYGSISDSIFIDSESPLGAYRIDVWLEEPKKENDTTSEETDTEAPRISSFSANYYVDEYKKPEYKVDIKPEKEQYTNNEVLSFDVQADYYFGSPVQEADVTYKIFKKPLYKPWWYFSPYRWLYQDYYSAETQQFSGSVFIYEGKTKLDKMGKANVLYSIEEDFKEGTEDNYYETDYIYIIQAIVRDKSRRNVSIEKTVNVTRSDYYMSVKTDKYLYKPGEKAGIQVYAADFGDKPVDCNYVISVYKVEQVGKPKKKKKTVTTFITNLSGKTYKTGPGTAFFDPPGEGYYQIEVTSFDSKQRKIKQSTSLYVSDGKNRGWWWGNMNGTLDIITDKDSYVPGDTCRALIMTGYPDVQVLITSKNNNIINYNVTRMEGTSMYVDVPVDENCAPNFAIDISYIKEGRSYRNEKKVLVLPETKLLNLSLTSDKQIYKPREEGTISIKVVDNTGAPVKNTEVSLGMIDESIYAIKDEQTKDIKSFFYGPRDNQVYSFYNLDKSPYVGAYSRYALLLEKFNIKSYKEEDLAIVRGRLINWKEEGIQNAYIMIDSLYLAAVTVKNGEFDFKIPEGRYSITIIKGDEFIEGAFGFRIGKGEKAYYRLMSGATKLFSVNDENGEDIRLFTGDIMTDTVEIISERKEIGVDQSGRRIDRQDISLDYGSVFIDNSGIQGIHNIVAKTSGVVQDERGANINIRGNRTDGNLVIVDGVVVSNPIEYVEAETRKDFRDAVYWSSSVVTDENGEAQVKIKFPDNLTSWRITARAITKDSKVNQTTYSVTERKDLIIRVAAPRFFQQRDEVIVSTIVHNYLNEEKQTKVTLKLDNVKLDSSVSEQEIRLGKNEERRIDWKLKVTEPIGFAKVYASALTNEESDAMENTIPIQPFGLKISSSNSYDLSKLNGSTTKTIEIPENTDLRSATLKIGISPSVASSLLGSLDELIGYPYGCIEQTMSRFIPTVVTAKILKDLNAPSGDYIKTFLPKMVKKGFNKINSLQHYDGGWGWWGNTSEPSELFISSYVVYGMTLANQSGYPPNKDVYKKGIIFLTNTLSKKKINLTTKAFIIYTLANTDSVKSEIIKPHIQSLSEEKLNNYAMALLSLTAGKVGDKETQQSILDELMRNANSVDDGLYWGGKVKSYTWQDDKIQTTAMVVKAIIADSTNLRENLEIIEKAVNWLMVQKKGSGWGNTLHNSLINYSLSDYIKITKESNPDYTMKVFINNLLVDESRIIKEDIFKPEKIIYAEGSKLKTGENTVRIEKNGIGKIYFNVTSVFYTNEKHIETRENGFEVKREYYKLKKVSNVKNNTLFYRKEKFDGTVKSGEEIFVKVTIIPDSLHNQYFMLEDPIPAGCEFIREEWPYQIEGETKYSGTYYSNWIWWFAQKEYRDNRICFFATELRGEKYEFTYLLRAEIPGTFNVMPSTGSLMYYPEVNGSGKNIKVKIQDN